MVVEEKWIVRRPLDGVPKLDDFELVKSDVGPVGEGEIAFKAEFVSVDPYLRYRAAAVKPPATMPGSIVATVTESKHPKFSAGQRILAHCGWVKTGKLNPEVKELSVMPAPEIGSLSPSLLLGACGMPGVTAYKGLLELCQPKQGETVLVNAAAGAVGSLVGQVLQ